MNAWESIFLQSPVNDGCYEEEDLPQSNWDWPKETWFQSRLDHVREHEPRRRLRSYRRPGFSAELRAA
ncbi:MAG TPA: hypothetical protein VLA17_13010 [Candidatus Limnocylindria bacterium]|nr:hypothetical protein [Candidatus Limnocylindria bacterium]